MTKRSFVRFGFQKVFQKLLIYCIGLTGKINLWLGERLLLFLSSLQRLPSKIVYVFFSKRTKPLDIRLNLVFLMTWRSLLHIHHRLITHSWQELSRIEVCAWCRYSLIDGLDLQIRPLIANRYHLWHSEVWYLVLCTAVALRMVMLLIHKRVSNRLSTFWSDHK